MKSLKERLSSNSLTVGSWITLAHPAIAEIMARAGFEWLVIDLEHSVITMREAGELIRTASLCGAEPLVRLTSNDPNQIKRVMDAGAHGVIVPMVLTKEDAQKAVSAVYYPGKGNRGVGLARAQGYGASFDDYRKWLDKNATVIIQIEHVKAVDNLESILSVSGVDGYIIGPYDLSASMGISGKFDSPDFIAAIEKIRKTGSAMNKPGGMHVVEPDTAQLMKYVKDGFKFLAYSVDIRMLDVSCRSGLSTVRGAL